MQNVQLVGASLGDFSGASSVQDLQQALTGLSMAAGWPAANPGAITGQVTPQTVMAVAAVVSNLGGKIDGTVKAALQVALAIASTNTSAMGTAKSLIAQYAEYLRPLVLGLTAVYTKGAKIPAPPTPPAAPTNLPFFTMQKMAVLKTSTALPAGSIQAQTKTGLYRVAVPAQAASGLGGPDVSLGATFFEVAPRTAPTQGVQLVSESELDAKTKDVPFYKKPLYWAAVGGVLAVGGGAWWMIRK